MKANFTSQSSLPLNSSPSAQTPTAFVMGPIAARGSGWLDRCLLFQVLHLSRRRAEGSPSATESIGRAHSRMNVNVGPPLLSTCASVSEPVNHIACTLKVCESYVWKLQRALVSVLAELVHQCQHQQREENSVHAGLTATAGKLSH